MKKINDLLERFKQIQKDSEDNKDYILDLLKGNGIKNLKKDFIFITKNTIRVKSTPIVKNQIFLKQKILISEIQKNPVFKDINIII